MVETGRKGNTPEMTQVKPFKWHRKLFHIGKINYTMKESDDADFENEERYKKPFRIFMGFNPFDMRRTDNILYVYSRGRLMKEVSLGDSGGRFHLVDLHAIHCL